MHAPYYDARAKSRFPFSEHVHSFHFFVVIPEQSPSPRINSPRGRNSSSRICAISCIHMHAVTARYLLPVSKIKDASYTLTPLMFAVVSNSRKLWPDKFSRYSMGGIQTRGKCKVCSIRKRVWSSKTNAYVTQSNSLSVKGREYYHPKLLSRHDHGGCQERHKAESFN